MMSNFLPNMDLDQLASAMVKELPKVMVPVLMIHARSDHDVPYSSMQSIYDHLGGQVKEMQPVEGMKHSLVMDRSRVDVFEVISRFLPNI